MELHKFERQLKLMMLLTQNRKYTLEELSKRLDMSARNGLSEVIEIIGSAEFH